MTSSNKKDDICHMCQSKQTLKSGWGHKSPPQDQMKKKRFRRRWHTLSIYQQCEQCFVRYTGGAVGSGGGGVGSGVRSRNCLMLTYFKDETEQSIKGRFQVDKGSLSAVNHIEEHCPSKYRGCPYLLRWEFPAYGNRILYMVMESETERDLWIKAFENFFKIEDQNASIEDDFEDKEEETFHPETNSKLQRAIAASKRCRNKDPFVLPTDQNDLESDFPHGTSPPKRSAGSFLHNDGTDEFEEEEDSTQRGYSYLPPKRSSQSSQSSNEYLPPPKQSSSFSSHTAAPDSVDGNEEQHQGYNYLPPKHGSPLFIRSQSSKINHNPDQDLNLENYTFLPPPLKESPTRGDGKQQDDAKKMKRLKSNERNMNYCNVQGPKPISPISTMNPWTQQPKGVFGVINGSEDATGGREDDNQLNLDNYTVLPPPKAMSNNNVQPPQMQKQNRKQQQQRSLKSKGTQQPTTDMNYSYVPPPKPVTIARTPTTQQQQPRTMREEVDNENYSFVPPPKPITPCSTKTNNPWKAREVEDRNLNKQHGLSFVPLPKNVSPTPVDEENYSVLPPPKLVSPTRNEPTAMNGIPAANYNYLPPKCDRTSATDHVRQGMSNMSIRPPQLKHEKYVGKSVNNLIQESNDPSKDDNYINFAPIQQMKMIARHNLKPVKFGVESPSGEQQQNSSYVNFEFP